MCINCFMCVCVSLLNPHSAERSGIKAHVKLYYTLTAQLVFSIFHKHVCMIFS